MSDDLTAPQADPTDPTPTPTPTAQPPTASAQRWSGRRLVLVGLLLFVCGMVTGAGLLALHAAHRWRTMAGNPGQVAAAAMTRRLGLSSEQRAKVDAILEKHKAEFAAVRRQMTDSYKSMAEEIKAVLTPEQQREFDTMLSRMRKAGMVGGGPGHRPHGPRGPDGPGGPEGHDRMRDGFPPDGPPPGPPPPGAER